MTLQCSAVHCGASTCSYVHQVIAQYNMLFWLLLRVRHAELCLSGAWLALRERMRKVDPLDDACRAVHRCAWHSRHVLAGLISGLAAYLQVCSYQHPPDLCMIGMQGQD